MRLIFLTLGYHPDLVGGAYRYVAEVAPRLAARGHEVHVICPNPANALASSEARDGVFIRRFPDGNGPFWRNWTEENQAARALLRDSFQAAPVATVLINCHAFLEPATGGFSNQLFLFTGPWAMEHAYARRRQNRRPAGLGLDVLVETVMRRMERQALGRARAVLTISEYYAHMLPRWHGAGIGSAQIISGGVDGKRFRPSPDREDFRRRHGVGDGEFVFLSVRRLETRMGLEALVAAFAGVHREHPRSRLWIAGKGGLAPVLEGMAGELGVGDACRLLGFVPEAELSACYSAADCTVMPSLDLEGFGLATAESLACGTPVIGSNAGATPELLRPLADDLLFQPGSVESLAGLMGRFVAAPDALPSRARCRNYAETAFDWARPVSGIESAASRLIKQGGLA